jgi:hypothetical protein
MRRLTASVTVALGMVAALALGLTAPASAVVTSPTVFNSMPKGVLPPDVASWGFEEKQTSGLGDAISFAPGTTNQLRTVTVVMSSRACQSGTWQADCVSAADSTFSIPIYLSVYKTNTVDPSLPGDFLGTATKVARIHYRPSADPINCPATPERWVGSDGLCHDGFAQKVTISFAGIKVLLPPRVVYNIRFNTSGFGPSPRGYDTPCYVAPEGCPYDSLRVGAGSTKPRRGIDLYPDGVFLNSATPENYCDDGDDGTGTFRLDDGCWTGSNPMVLFKVRTS